MTKNLKNYRIVRRYGYYFIQVEVKFYATFDDVVRDFFVFSLFLLPFWRNMKRYQPTTEWRYLKLPKLIGYGCNVFDTEESAREALALYLSAEEIINL